MVTGVQIDVEVLEALEFQPGCEGMNHPAGHFGHIPTEPARWLTQYPCGLSMFTCDGWTQESLRDPSRIQCACAATFHYPDELRFIPIGTP